MAPDKEINVDVLIVGSGLAGLLLALKLSECCDLTIALATKGALLESNSSHAQGGVAAVTSPGVFDSPQQHLEDTLRAGCGLSDRAAATRIISGGKMLIDELARQGVHFDRQPDGSYELALEGGHSQSRVLHTRDTTGKSITNALAASLIARQSHCPRIHILENQHAYSLVMRDASCAGASFISSDSNRHLTVLAPNTVLATGGVGQIFARTTNPAIATGDGIALAYRAGATLKDMEFVQFHPTALALPGAPPFLISEAVRGAGATLLDHEGRRFMHRFSERAELATRDLVARAIQTVMLEHHLPSVWLDMRPIGPSLAERFPNIVQTCARYGIDVSAQSIPISPAAHYFMGGIQATPEGITDVPGLFAIGECASTGLHGANRLASNSLLEAGVSALLLADYLASSAIVSSARNANSRNTYTPHIVSGDITTWRNQMYRHAGLIRSEPGLSTLLSQDTTALVPARLQDLSPQAITGANIFLVGQLIANAALLRRESRGSHWRSDYASPNDGQFLKHLALSKNGAQWQTQLATRPSRSLQSARSA